MKVAGGRRRSWACADMGWRGWRRGGEGGAHGQREALRKRCGGAWALSGRQNLLQLRRGKGGRGKALRFPKLGEEMGGGGSGTLETSGAARLGICGWASCPVGKEGSVSVSLQDP